MKNPLFGELTAKLILNKLQLKLKQFQIRKKTKENEFTNDSLADIY